MSGAGKSTALKMLEDVGYFCVDNLPVPLVPKLAELLRVPNSEINKIALGIDIRSGYIYQHNKAVIKDPNNVPIGTVIEIPAPESYGIDAKSRESREKAAALQTEILAGE